MDDSNNNANCQHKSFEPFHIYNYVTGEYFMIDNYQKSLYKLRKRIFSWAQVTSTRKSDLGNYYILIQLSYAKNSDWQPKQLTNYLQEVIKIIERQRIYDYAWVLEVKPIGRNLHYHVAIHCQPGTKIPMPDKSGMWVYGSTNIYADKSSPYYLVKYTSKEKQKFNSEVPKGARTYNTWLNSDHYEKSELMEHKKSAYPSYIANYLALNGIEKAQIKRKEGGGWSILVTDVWHDLEGLKIDIESPWVVFRGVRELEVYLPNFIQKYQKSKKNETAIIEALPES
jgi:hypothetical protein